jgi:hypothetical protein
MNLAQVTSVDLKHIAKLVGQKESLQAQIAKIDTELGRFESGQPAAPAKSKPGQKPGRPAKAKPAKVKRAARGSVRAAIIELVKGAGESGITVKAIAAKLGMGYSRVFTWFYNTGNRIKTIKKAGPGKYVWVK